LHPRAFGFGTSVDELTNFLKLRGRRDLTADNLPRLLWFPDPQEATSAQELSLSNISAQIGPSVRFAGATVEIADDPIVIDIREKLPWIKSLEGKPPGAPPLYLLNKLAIVRGLFMRRIADRKSGSE
jgi:hypothetical protein